MSVINAILFYSKHVPKSAQLKKLVENYNIDIDTVCVDSREVKERLLDDEQYGIDRVPTVLVIYSTGAHKLYIGESLDNWFQQLIHNIQNYAAQAQQQQALEEQTPIAAEPITDHGHIPKELKRRSRVSPDVRSTLPAPGSKVESGPGTLGGNIPISAMPITGDNDVTPLSEEPAIRKEIKTDSISAAERAKQMAAMREELDEELEQNKPFM